MSRQSSPSSCEHGAKNQELPRRKEQKKKNLPTVLPFCDFSQKRFLRCSSCNYLLEICKRETPGFLEYAVSACRWVGLWGLLSRVYHLSLSHPKAFLRVATCSCRSGSTAKHQSVAARTVCFSFLDRNLAFNSNLLSFVMPDNYTTAHAHTHVQHKHFGSSQPT